MSNSESEFLAPPLLMIPKSCKLAASVAASNSSSAVWSLFRGGAPARGMDGAAAAAAVGGGIGFEGVNRGTLAASYCVLKGILSLLNSW